VELIKYFLDDRGSSKPEARTFPPSVELFSRMVQLPKEFNNSDKIPLVAFCSLLPKETYPDGTPRRKLDNLEYSYCGLVDWDSGSNFETVREGFKSLGIEAYMYTSFNHGNPAKGTQDRFRAIIPFEQRTLGQMWRDAGPDGLSIFHSLFSFGMASPDIVSFRPTHGHRVPAIHPLRADKYRFAIIKGNRFDPVPYLEDSIKIFGQSQSFKGVKKAIGGLNPVSTEYGNTVYFGDIPLYNSFEEQVINSTLERLNALPWAKRGSGTVHSSLLKIVANLRHCKIPEAKIREIMEAFIPFSQKGELESML